MFCAALMAAFQDSNVGVDLFTNSYIGYVTVRNLLFSHDCGLIANMNPKMQRVV